MVAADQSDALKGFAADKHGAVRADHDLASLLGQRHQDVGQVRGLR